MRVLVLNGSPKGDKSNTYRLTSAFLDGLRQTQPVKAETIEVGKLHLLPCRGCFACWSKTPGKCVLQDDMAGVIGKILAADVLIWSFPLYYFSIPGQLKLLIDRAAADVAAVYDRHGLRRPPEPVRPLRPAAGRDLDLRLLYRRGQL